jgi:hypothetical protein
MREIKSLQGLCGEWECRRRIYSIELIEDYVDDGAVDFGERDTIICGELCAV